MSAVTSIEWTDAVWNPVRGCSLVSAGCANCYAMKFAHRFSGPSQLYAGLTELGPQGPRWTGKVTLVHDALDEPLRWKTPRRIFVNSMSDLFHEDVPFDFVHWVFSTIRQTPQHTYQILTKRPDRMRQFIAEYLKPRESLGWGNGFYRHVWIGVSIEDQATADERIPILLETPAAVRFVSAEPLLGPVDLERVPLPDPYLKMNGISGVAQPLSEKDTEPDDYRYYRRKEMKLNWVIVGGESGPGARPCDVAWIRTIKNQCQEGGVPVFVKQLGTRPYVVEDSLAAKEWGAFDAAVAVMDDIGQIHTKDRKGGDMAEWPEDLRVREFPR